MELPKSKFVGRRQFCFQHSSGQALILVVLVVAVILIGGMSRIGDFYNRNRRTADKEARANRHEMSEVLEELLFETASQIAFGLGSGALTCDLVSTNLVSRWPKVFRDVKWSLWDGNGVDSTDLRHQDAIQRCQTGQYLSPSDSYASRNGIYFCLKVAPNAPGDRAVAMLSDGPVFVEVGITLKNLFSNSFIPCNAFRTSSAAVRGATLSFATYWSRQKGSERVYFTHIEQRSFLTN